MDEHINRLGIEQIGVFGLPPVDFINLAADLGCRYISTGISPTAYNPHGYPRFSLKDDPALRREMMAAMRDRGVSISLGEGFGVRPGMDLRDRAADLDVMAGLGVKRVNAVSMDPDLNRTFDQLGILVEMASKAGMETTVEFAPTLGIPDLATALAAIRHVGRRDFKLLIDTMHVGRSGATAADIAALDPEMIGYVQLCDVKMKPQLPSYLEEAMFERLPPGEGEVPLRDILAVLPRHLVIGLEVPMRARALAGEGPRERMAPCVKAARKLLAEIA